MKIRMTRCVPAVLAALTAFACSGPAKAGPKDTTPVSKPGPTPTKTDAKPAPKGPVAEKAATLREAAALLDRAASTLADGNKFLAEQQFSFAEQLVGDAALAGIASMFREGAPPKVATPTTKIDTAAPPQPKVAGNSETDDVAAKVPQPPEVGSLTGMLLIDGKAANAYGLITLEPASGKFKARTPKRVVIEQRGREFLPSLVAVSVGSTISFPNFDTVFHNVFSTSPLAAFDLGLYKAGEAREFTFAKEGFIRLGCNLHANMSAYIAVVSAPAYVVTDDKGAFSFKRLAPGKYKLRAWSVKSKNPITQDITIKVGKNEVNVGVSADAPAGPPTDKFGGKRG